MFSSRLPSQVFGETMLAAGQGSIVNIASMAGMIPLSRVVAYSAAKAAVLNLTQFLAREWATKGVRVNAISPGFFPAEQNRAMLLKPDGGYTERGGQIIGHTPMGRFGAARELAGAVVWLAAPRASSFVTGQNIVVDGGFSSVIYIDIPVSFSITKRVALKRMITTNAVQTVSVRDRSDLKTDISSVTHTVVIGLGKDGDYVQSP